MSEELNPITRTEMFLAKAAGQNTPELTPITRVERFLQNLIDHIKSIGTGGGGATQPDWNAMEGEPGHILNRTHWKKFTELVPEISVEIDDEGWGNFANPFEVVLGQKYQIAVNGVSYDARGMMSGEVPGVVTTDSDFMFLIAHGSISGDDSIMFVVAPNHVSQTITLSVNEVTTTQIPVEYLPSSFISHTVSVLKSIFEGGNTASITYDTTELADALIRGAPIFVELVGEYRIDRYNAQIDIIGGTNGGISSLKDSIAQMAAVYGKNAIYLELHFREQWGDASSNGYRLILNSPGD